MSRAGPRELGFMFTGRCFVGGMKKKAYAALEAFKLGVKKVIICSGLSETPILDALEKNAGTVIINE